MTKKSTYRKGDDAVCQDDRLKIKVNEKRNKYLDLVRELKKAIKHDRNGDTRCNWCAWNDPQKFGKWVEKLGNKRTNKDHPNHSIAKIGQNTEKNPGDLRRRTVTQTPVKDHLLKPL